MSVGVLLLTHPGIGEALLATVEGILGHVPDNLDQISIDFDACQETVIVGLRDRILALDQGDGVIVMADLYGATPCNIAMCLVREAGIHVLTGVNLPMLIRLLNYQGLDLHSLLLKAYEGGRDGVRVLPEHHPKDPG